MIMKNIKDYLSATGKTPQQVINELRTLILKSRIEIWESIDHERQLLFYNNKDGSYQIHGLDKDNNFIPYFHGSDLERSIINAAAKDGYQLLNIHNYKSFGITESLL